MPQREPLWPGPCRPLKKQGYLLRRLCMRGRSASRGVMGHSILLASVLMLSSVVSVEAAELKIIAGGGIAAALNEIAAQFESNTGHTTIIRYGTTPELIKMATGTSFDL